MALSRISCHAHNGLPIQVQVELALPEVHGDGVGQGGVAGVVVQVEAHINGVTERQDRDSIVASVNVQRRDHVTHEVQRCLETVFTDRTGRVHREHDVRPRLTGCEHT